FRAVAADVAGDLTAPCRMADVDRVLQVESFDELRQVVGVCVHFVAIPRLTRPAMAATGVGGAAVSACGQNAHRCFRGVCARWPTVAEDYGLSAAAIFIVDVDVAGIFFTNADVWHLKLSFLYCHFLLRNDRCSGLPQRDSPPTFLSVIVRPFVGPATSHYAGSKPRAHYEIECFSATTVGRMW